MEYRDCRNPVLPPEMYIPDTEAHVMPDGRVYIYGSWDQAYGSYCSEAYRVFSSADMVDWTDHGVSFRAGQVPWFYDGTTKGFQRKAWESGEPTPFLKELLQRAKASKAEPPAGSRPVLYAPDAIHHDGRYYLYFCADDFSEGVAVADKPEGPFADPVRIDCEGIDPAIFIDDDGQAYYYWGQFRANGAKMKPNMIEIDQDTIVRNLLSEEEHGFHEGSSLRKRGDTYYFVYPSIFSGRPTALAYATSDNPLGPFTYRGVIVDNAHCDPQSWNIHGSIEEVNGQWYVFYHRSTGNSRSMRRFCAEPIFFDDQGAIAEVKMTSQGAGRPFELGEEIEGWRACEVSGGNYIAGSKMHVSSGGTVTWRYVDWKTAPSTCRLTASGQGSFTLLADGEVIATLTLDGSGETIAKVRAQQGRHELVLRCDEADAVGIDVLVIA